MADKHKSIMCDRSFREWHDAKLNERVDSYDDVGAFLDAGEHEKVPHILRQLSRNLVPQYMASENNDYIGSDLMRVRVNKDQTNGGENYMEIGIGIQQTFESEYKIDISTSFLNPYVDWFTSDESEQTPNKWAAMWSSTPKIPDVKKATSGDRTQSAIDYSIKEMIPEIIAVEENNYDKCVLVDPTPGTISRITKTPIVISHDFSLTELSSATLARSSQLNCRIEPEVSSDSLLYTGFYPHPNNFRGAFGFEVNPYSHHMRVSGRMHSITETEYGYQFSYYRKNSVIKAKYKHMSSRFRFQSRYMIPMLQSRNHKFYKNINDFYLMNCTDFHPWLVYLKDVAEVPDVNPVGLVPVKKYDDVRDLGYSWYGVDHNVKGFYFEGKLVDVALPLIASDRRRFMEILRDNQGVIIARGPIDQNWLEHPTSGCRYKSGNLGCSLMDLGVVTPLNKHCNIEKSIKKVKFLQVGDNVHEMGDKAVSFDGRESRGFQIMEHVRGRYRKIEGYFPTMPCVYDPSTKSVHSYIDVVADVCVGTIDLIGWYNNVSGYRSRNLVLNEGDYLRFVLNEGISREDAPLIKLVKNRGVEGDFGELEIPKTKNVKRAVINYLSDKKDSVVYSKFMSDMKRYRKEDVDIALQDLVKKGSASIKDGVITFIVTSI